MRLFAFSASRLTRRRQGSVFVLVVAILAVIGLLTITLAYSTRMELQASRNSVEAVQARLSALTSVPFVTPGNPLSPVIGVTSDEDAALGGVSPPPSRVIGSGSLFRGGSGTPERVPLNLMIKPKALARSQARAARQDDTLSPSGSVTTDLRARNLRERESSRQEREGRLTEGGGEDAIIADMGEFTSGIAFSRISDESAKFNINAFLPAPSGEVPTDAENIRQLVDPRRAGPAAVPNARHLATLIELAAHARDIALDRPALDLANDIAAYRYGPDGAPGVAGIDDNGNSGSVRPGSDGIDNDGDWVIDNPEEETLAVDADGVDNNFDGVVDEMGETLLEDLVDNDGDGVVDNPTEAVDDPGEFVHDIRLPAHGDDRPYVRLSELGAIRGMTPELIDALKPYLTVFSVAHPAYAERRTSGQTQGQLAIRQLDPNTAGAEEIFDALRGQYPSLPEGLLAQFAVNIIDRRDADGSPTEARLGAAGKTYRGLEITPCISEVFPYTGGFDQDQGGDDGQFIEITNPFTTPIDVTGWRIEGAGTVLNLNGTLDGGGLLVYTDDYNNSLDPEPEKVPGQGSLYDIFGTVATGGKTRIEVVPSMEIPNEGGSIRLYNKQGALIDEFRYEGGKLSGVLKYSYQRKDPRIRKDVYTRDDCDYGTPLKPNQAGLEPTGEERRMMELVEQFYDRPFFSPLEILLVPTNYDATDEVVAPNESGDSGITAQSDPSAEAGGDSDATGTGNGFRLPYLGTTPRTNRAADKAEEDAEFAAMINNLDVTVVDLFMPGVPRRRDTRMMSFFAAGLLGGGESLPEGAAPLSDRIEMEWRERRDRAPALHGRININTAAPVLLSALPGMGADFAYVIATLREQWMYGQSEFLVQPTAGVDVAVFESKAWTRALPPQESVRWRSLSDFLADDGIWGADTRLVNRIEGAYPFANMITFHSLSYRVVTENIPAPTSDDRRPTLVRTERIISGDRGGPETVRFDMLTRPGWVQEDKDIRFGVPQTAAADLSKELLAGADMNRSLPRYDGPAFPASLAPMSPMRGAKPGSSGASHATPLAANSPRASEAPSADSATDRPPIH